MLPLAVCITVADMHNSCHYTLIAYFNLTIVFPTSFNKCLDIADKLERFTFFIFLAQFAYRKIRTLLAYVPSDMRPVDGVSNALADI